MKEWSKQLTLKIIRNLIKKAKERRWWWGQKQQWFNIFESLVYEKETEYSCSICQKLIKTREGPCILEPAQSYHIDKIHKNFGGVLQSGHKGTDPKDLSPAIRKVLLFVFKSKKKLWNQWTHLRNIIFNRTSTKKE